MQVIVSDNVGYGRSNDNTICPTSYFNHWPEHESSFDVVLSVRVIFISKKVDCVLPARNIIGPPDYKAWTRQDMAGNRDTLGHAYTAIFRELRIKKRRTRLGHVGDTWGTREAQLRFGLIGNPFFLQVAFTGATKGGAGKPPGLAAATAVWSRRRRLHSTAAVPQVQEPLLPTATMLEQVTLTSFIYLNRSFLLTAAACFPCSSCPCCSCSLVASPCCSSAAAAAAAACCFPMLFPCCLLVCCFPVLLLPACVELLIGASC